jgi:hypothetical protein
MGLRNNSAYDQKQTTNNMKIPTTLPRETRINTEAGFLIWKITR